MNPLEMMAHIQNKAMEIVELVSDYEPFDLVKMGLGPFSSKLRKLHKIYFEPCDSPNDQELARKSAFKRGLTMTDLSRIERILNELTDKSYTWQLRRELCNCSPGNMLNYGRQRLIELQGAPKPAPRLRFSSNHLRDEASLHITARSSLIADIRHAIHSRTTKTTSPAEAFFSLWNSGAPGVQLSATVGIMLSDAYKLIDGSSHDSLFARTDGGTVTGAEVVEMILKQSGYIALIDPVKGPVNLYRTSRFASEKQRHLAAFVNPTCAAPGCSTPAKFCQTHHVKPWNNGGNTNQENLVTLCPYHNGLNDDSPDETPRNGHIVKRGCFAYWKSPIDGRLRLNLHPQARLAPLHRLMNPKTVISTATM